MSKKCKIDIEVDGNRIDLEGTYQLYLQESSNLFMPNISPYYTESYPESHGEFIYPITKFDAFDYEVKLVYVGSESGVSKHINDFLNIFFINRNNIKQAKEVTIINDYKEVSFPAYFKEITKGDKFIRGQRGIANFNLKFRVTKPQNIEYIL